MKQVYCYLRNKQFKFFKDNSMLVLDGIIDFDLVQTVVILVNQENQVDPDEAASSKRRPQSVNRKQTTKEEAENAP